MADEYSLDGGDEESETLSEPPRRRKSVGEDTLEWGSDSPTPTLVWDTFDHDDGDGSDAHSTTCSTTAIGVHGGSESASESSSEGEPAFPSECEDTITVYDVLQLMEVLINPLSEQEALSVERIGVLQTSSTRRWGTWVPLPGRACFRNSTRSRSLDVKGDIMTFSTSASTLQMGAQLVIWTSG